jgi:hypothetical protein
MKLTKFFDISRSLERMLSWLIFARHPARIGRSGLFVDELSK